MVCNQLFVRTCVLFLVIFFSHLSCLSFVVFITTARYYGEVLRCLYPLFGESEPDDAVRDNAAGAVARMIMVHPDSVPLNQVRMLLHCDLIKYIFLLLIFFILYLGPSCFLESSSTERRSRGINDCLQLCL